MNDYKSTLKRIKITFLISVFLFCVELLLILIFFRKIRYLFPIPEIGDSKIVGFSQYFGYPFYFDTFIFFVILLSILFFVILAHNLVKYFNR